MTSLDASVAPLPQTAESDRPSGGAVSFAFWLCLFACAAVYAVVFLAPKLIKNAELTRAERASQWRLIELQRRIDYLERLATAYEVDPAFVREKARSEFDVRPPGEEVIPVPGHLTLQIGSRAKATPAGERVSDSIPSEPWYLPYLRTLVSRPQLGTVLLTVTAVVMVFAFTFLQKTGSRRSQG
ncbi:MAG: septum formation initiator family protein [Planctomycetota bacterium]|nr:septum formation initiator family protein [Planctomycetota bacterium]